jgi:hypothetical protein
MSQEKYSILAERGYVCMLNYQRIYSKSNIIYNQAMILRNVSQQ